MLVRGDIRVINLLETIFVVGDCGICCFLYMEEQEQMISDSYEKSLLILQKPRRFALTPMNIQ